MTKERWAAYMREYRKRNLEKSREASRENYYKHREARLEYKKLKRKENKNVTRNETNSEN